MYGGEKKMTILKNLYPNIVTKEELLTPEELEPLRNHSSQVGTPCLTILLLANLLSSLRAC